MAAGIIRQLTFVTQNYGVFGLGIGMFLESLGIPFVSALVALTAGTLIASGRTTYWQALLFTTAGLTLGSVVSYYIGYWGVALRRFLPAPRRMGKSKNSKLMAYLECWGEIAVIFAQLFGMTRTWISIPAGAMKMKLQKFILYTAIGGVVYCSITIGLSVVLASFLSRFLSWVQLRFVPLIALVILIAVSACVYKLRKNRQSAFSDTDQISKNPADE